MSDKLKRLNEIKDPLFAKIFAKKAEFYKLHPECFAPGSDEKIIDMHAWFVFLEEASLLPKEPTDE